MARPSAIHTLDPAHKKQLDDKLFENGFNGYTDLETWLRSLGYEISKSAIHRYGQRLESKTNSLKAATEMALYMQDQLGDDASALGGMTISMMQAEAFEAMVALKDLEELENPADRLLLIAKISKSMGELTRAGVAQKKWEQEVKDHARSELLAEQSAKLEEHAQAGGLGADQVDFWRREFLGVKK